MSARNIIILPVITGLISVAYLYGATTIRVPPFGGPVNGRVFPYILGAALLIASLMVVLEQFRKRASDGNENSGTGDMQSIRLVALITIWTAAYAFILEPAGYMIATSVYLIGLCLYFYRGNRVAAIATAVGFSVAAYVVMDKLLGVQLPAGPLF